MLNKYSMSLKISASLFNGMKKKIEQLDNNWMTSYTLFQYVQPNVRVYSYFTYTQLSIFQEIRYLKLWLLKLFSLIFIGQEVY